MNKELELINIALGQQKIINTLINRRPLTNPNEEREELKKIRKEKDKIYDKFDKLINPLKK